MEITGDSKNITANNGQTSDAVGQPFLKAPHSKFFKILVISLAGLILLIGAFSLGIQVGFRKAFFTYAWSQNYPNNFGGKTMLPPPPLNGQFFNAHGLDGTILSTGAGSLVIKDEDSNEKTISVSPQTVIRQNFQTLMPGDLKTGEEIVVIGNANGQGQIDAKLIRVLNNQ